MITELPQDWGSRLFEGTTKPRVYQHPGERSTDPRGTDPDLPVSVQESPAEACVLGGLLQGRGHRAAVCARDLLKEATTVFITSTIVWSRVKQQGGNTALPINRKLD